MLRRLRVDEDGDMEQALIAARPEPEPLSPGKANAVFEQALAASRVCERLPGRRRRRLLWFAAGPMAATAAAAVAGLFLMTRGSDRVPSARTTMAAALAPAPVPKKEPPKKPSRVIADQRDTAALAAATNAAARPSLVWAARRSRRPQAAEARLAEAGVTPTVTSLPPAATAPEATPQAAVVAADAPPAPDSAAASPVIAGRLLVSVTSAPPVLQVAVREAAPDVPGYAQAAAVHSDAYRRPYWTQYTVSSENTSAEVVLIAPSESGGDAPSSENRTGNEKE